MKDPFWSYWEWTPQRAKHHQTSLFLKPSTVSQILHALSHGYELKGCPVCEIFSETEHTYTKGTIGKFPDCYHCAYLCKSILSWDLFQLSMNLLTKLESVMEFAKKFCGEIEHGAHCCKVCSKAPDKQSLKTTQFLVHNSCVVVSQPPLLRI